MELFALLKVFWPTVVAWGPAAIGWVLSLALGYYILDKRKEVDDAMRAVNAELIAAKDEYNEELQQMYEKLADLNKKHMEITNSISEARIEDLKELTSDYNKLASETLRTMDRFVVALEVSNNIKKKREGDK